MKTATIKTIEQSDKVGLYSICFDGNDLTEYEKFVQKFMNDATLNEDFRKIFRAINRIVANGALERYFRPEGRMKDNLAALSIDSKICVYTAYAYPTKSLLSATVVRKPREPMRKVRN